MREALLRVGREFPVARQDALTDHPLAHFIRTTLPADVREALGEFGPALIYSSDRDIFERMIKGREVAKAITSVDLGRLFYDKANEVSPHNSFVWQQRAVFETRHKDGSLELAEKNAGAAHELNPTSRSIEHTQADIARRLALKQSDQLQRTAYRKASREKLNKFSSEGSEYDLHTRCLLALDELQEALNAAKEDDINSSRRIVEVTKEAETTVLGARRLFPDSIEILTAEARYKELMRDNASALKILEKAFTRNPRQDWLAVRLAKGYLEEGRKNDAITVLRKSLAESPAGKLAHLELGFLLMNDADPKVAAEHFAKAYRQGDDNFDAQFWHARQLFVLGENARSKQLFADVNDRAPDRFRHGADGAILTREGTTRRYGGEIDRKEEGYGFVRLTDLPERIFASRAESDRDEWHRLTRGSKVLASIAFNRRGARAIEIRSAS